VIYILLSNNHPPLFNLMPGLHLDLYSARHWYTKIIILVISDIVRYCWFMILFLIGLFIFLFIFPITRPREHRCGPRCFRSYAWTFSIEVLSDAIYIGIFFLLSCRSFSLILRTWNDLNNNNKERKLTHHPVLYS
jgi:hypothetical protein